MTAQKDWLSGGRFDVMLRFVLAEMNPESFVIFTAVS